MVLIGSIILHEVAHGFVALKCGDATAKNAGRLTLNPIPHIDLFGSIILPAILIVTSMLSGIGILIAWAKPVPIDPKNFNKTRKGLFLVSIAGIAMNFFIVAVVTILIRLFGAWPIGPIQVFTILFPILLVNAVIGFFNLLPIPPLDGATVLMTSLGFSLERQNRVHAFIGRFFVFFLIFLIIPLLLSGALSYFFTLILRVVSILIGEPIQLP